MIFNICLIKLKSSIKNEDLKDKLFNMGLNLGMAFQLSDDYLDYNIDDSSNNYGKETSQEQLENKYIEYVADRLIVSLGYEKIYKTTNPFTFMDTIGLIQKTNLHESRSTEYQSAYNSNTSKTLSTADGFSVAFWNY